MSLLMVMNLGFGWSEVAAPAQTQSYAAPMGMGLGDELWLASILLCVFLARLL